MIDCDCYFLMRLSASAVIVNCQYNARNRDEPLLKEQT